MSMEQDLQVELKLPINLGLNDGTICPNPVLMSCSVIIHYIIANYPHP